MDTTWYTEQREANEVITAKRRALWDDYTEISRKEDRLWKEFPTAQEIEVIVKLVELVGYQVKKTTPLLNGCVGLELTDRTAPPFCTRGIVKRKIESRVPLTVYWENHFVSNTENAYAGMGHYERHLAVRLRRNVPAKTMVDLISTL